MLTASIPTVRQICFALYRSDTKLIDGSFTVTQEAEVSSFGTYREIESNGSAKPAIFEGAIIHHQLDSEGCASIAFNYYSVEPSNKSPIGYRQQLEVKAGLSMGSESGMEEVESVMLGNSHEFVFQTHVVA